MIDHLQSAADVRRSEMRRRHRIVRMWEERQFPSKPTAPSLTGVNPGPAKLILGTATIHCIAGHPFAIDGISASAEERYAAAAGIHADVVVVRLGAALGTFVRQAISVGQLDEMFATGRARLTARARAAVGAAGVVARVHPQVSASPELYDPWGSVPGRVQRRRKHCSTQQAEDAALRAILMALYSCPFLTMRAIHRRIGATWQCGWGQPPSYDTVRRWVHCARASRTGSLLRGRSDAGELQPSLGIGDGA